VSYQRPAVDETDLSLWCERYLGSRPVEELFRAGYLGCVIGKRLADGRKIVVKVRPAEPRVAACVAVQKALFLSGYPCPEPLTGAVPFHRYTATAESYIVRTTGLPAAGRSAQPFASALAQLIVLAPQADRVASLSPAPPWTAWNHEGAGLWPWPDDLDIDLNSVSGPAWVDDAGAAARLRLQDGQQAIVIGHGDWKASNLSWNGDRLRAAYDWDSLIADSEGVIVGLAAAIYPAEVEEPGSEATLTETEDFLGAYEEARCRAFSPGERQRSWAAGVWLRAFDSKKQYAVGQAVRSLTESEARERLRRAGMF
jgi:hypothetical protein